MREWLELASDYAVLLINTMALVIVVFGAVEAFVQAVRFVVFNRAGLEVRVIWLRFARLLVAGLTFQLAADIIETAVSNEWASLGRIAAIAVIRAFLNYFLEKDMRELDRRGSRAVKR